MNDEHLPPELRELEAELTAAFRAELPESLRPRVEKSRREEFGRRKNADRWRFAAAAAATALIWMNLSLCATSATDFFPQPSLGGSVDATAAARQLHEILPDLSPEEANMLCRKL